MDSVPNKIFYKKGTSIDTNTVKSVVLIDTNTEDPFFVLDLGEVGSLMKRWTRSLPEYRPFYAIKCNPERSLLAAMAALGSGFDCASRAEMEAVLALGVSPDRIIFANPCKLGADLEFAASAGVNLTTFDSPDEVRKIKALHPDCALLLRIKPPVDGGGVRSLGSKYGAHPEEVAPLLLAARDAGLRVAGVSFHVGSATTVTSAFGAAVAAARRAFDAAVSLGMPPMTVLDIGGGFFAGGGFFEEAGAEVNAAVSEHFGGEAGLTLVAEPGRFFAETAFTLLAKIMGKRVRGETREYWIHDGIYGSFMGHVVFNLASQRLTCMPLRPHAGETTMALLSFDECYDSTVFGPTCDSEDVVLRGYKLPELQVGDWLAFPNMGAYSSVFRSHFNGMNTSPYSTILCGFKLKLGSSRESRGLSLNTAGFNLLQVMFCFQCSHAPCNISHRVINHNITLVFNIHILCNFTATF